MRIQRFQFIINREREFLFIDKKQDWAIFKHPKWNLYNFKTEEEIVFSSFEEMLNFSLLGKTLKEFIEGMPDELPQITLKGGRGADSGVNTYSFSHASDGGSGSSSLFPAIANTKIKSKSLEGALGEFKRNHLLANREFAYEVDSDGFVHQYKKGLLHSVSISSSAKVRRGDTTMIIHNHPGGGAFSDSDLLSTSSNKRSKGIIASGKDYDYKFEKGSHFKAAQFAKAVKSAKIKGKTYDDAVDKWMRANQKKYGYKYTRTKN